VTASLNHTIVNATDAQASARFLTGILGLPDPVRMYDFEVVELGNGVSLDYASVDPGSHIHVQHYAFLISEEEFDAVYGRIVQQGIDHWADPFRRHPGEINRGDGGRGVYFPDPDGHLLEVITRPYGSGGG
jgi:catechol 2,3-dioxygenase-like lactoylglutathione lyase family enzyme